MKREFSRERNLPAFRIDHDQLELLWTRLFESLGEGGDVFTYSVLTVHSKHEKLTFNSIAEFVDADLNQTVDNFSLSLRREDKYIYMRSGNRFSYFSSINATGPSVAWCAGVVETAVLIAQSNKRWYSGMMSLPLGILIVILFNLPFAVNVASMKWPAVASLSNRPALIAWGAALASLFFIWLFRSKLMPSALITHDHDETLVRKYAPEIAIVLALISAVLSVVQIWTER